MKFHIFFSILLLITSASDDQAVSENILIINDFDFERVQAIMECEKTLSTISYRMDEFYAGLRLLCSLRLLNSCTRHFGSLDDPEPYMQSLRPYMNDLRDRYLNPGMSTFLELLNWRLRAVNGREPIRSYCFYGAEMTAKPNDMLQEHPELDTTALALLIELSRTHGVPGIIASKATDYLHLFIVWCKQLRKFDRKVVNKLFKVLIDSMKLTEVEKKAAQFIFNKDPRK